MPGLTWEVTLLRWACGAELAPAGAWLSPTPGGQGDGGAREDAGVWAEEPSSPKVTGRRAGRRYTLTEGDFHHLKNARLTHLHLPPLKIDPGDAPSSCVSLHGWGKGLEVGTWPKPRDPHSEETLGEHSPCSPFTSWGLQKYTR